MIRPRHGFSSTSRVASTTLTDALPPGAAAHVRPDSRNLGERVEVRTDATNQVAIVILLCMAAAAVSNPTPRTSRSSAKARRQGKAK